MLQSNAPQGLKLPHRNQLATSDWFVLEFLSGLAAKSRRRKMSREKKTIAISVVLCFLMAFVQSSRAGEVEERLATEAANAWLKLVDQDK
jgi:hypothetical protein